MNKPPNKTDAVYTESSRGSIPCSMATAAVHLETSSLGVLQSPKSLSSLLGSLPYKKLAEFKNNPMIEALPPPMDETDIDLSLNVRPPYSNADRMLDNCYRYDLTQRIVRFHQPMENDLNLGLMVGRCIRWGYVNRNVLDPAHIKLINDVYCASSIGECGTNYLDRYRQSTYGFALIGVSGLGKSTTMECILSSFPQVIHHTRYQGMPLQETQIVWMKLDCPPDGSLKGLCLNFLKEVDRLAGTRYSPKEGRSTRETTDTLMLQMASLCLTQNIGLIVVDEIQHLNTARDGKATSLKTLNFLVSLVNVIGVPVVLIGTPKIMPILQAEFQQAKRGSGQGDALWERMRQDDTWRLFLESMWQYQYTRHQVELTKELDDAMYHECLGIPFLTTQLYKLVQEQAIFSGTENFDAKTIHKVASKKMKLTEPLRNLIRENKDVDLSKCIDITPFTAKDYEDNYTIAHEKKKPAQKPPEKGPLAEETIITLMRLGLSHPEARDCTAAAMEQNKDCRTPGTIAQKAFLLYMDRTNEKPEPPSTPLSGATGYDDLVKRGLVSQGGF